MQIGGGEEIRTLGWVTPSPVFKTGSLDHSDTPPNWVPSYRPPDLRLIARSRQVTDEARSSRCAGSGLSRGKAGGAASCRSDHPSVPVPSAIEEMRMTAWPVYQLSAR